jgi:hypothetical protein
MNKKLPLWLMFAIFIVSCSTNGTKFIGNWIATDGSELTITNSGKDIYTILILGPNNGSPEGSFGSMFRGKTVITATYEKESLKTGMGIVCSFKDNAIIQNGKEYYKK